MSVTIHLCAALVRAAAGLPDDAELDIRALPLAEAARALAQNVKNEHDMMRAREKQLVNVALALVELVDGVLRNYDLSPSVAARLEDVIADVRFAARLSRPELP